MLDKIGGTGRGELYGLSDTIKTTKAEKNTRDQIGSGCSKKQR